MTTELAYPHIGKPHGEPARLERFPRIRVAQIVMDYLSHGWSAEEICRQHPHLTPAEVHAALGYYFDHQAEVDAEIQCEVDAVARARAQASPSPLRARMSDSGAS